MNIIKIWKSRGQIIEGITNSIFKREDVEEIAKERDKGGCGCSLSLKTRSLSSSCPHPNGAKWSAELTQEEEDTLNKKLGL